MYHRGLTVRVTKLGLSRTNNMYLRQALKLLAIQRHPIGLGIESVFESGRGHIFQLRKC
jgi:hypothetical protein